MSHYLSSEDQVEVLSHLDNTDETFDYDDAFTAGRPPQYNDSNHVPQTVVQDLMPSQMQGIRDHYPASCRTDSTATVLADKDAVTATAPTRDYILYHVNRNYDGDAEPLTEYAIAALNNDFHNRSYSGNVDEWVRGRSQFPPSDPMDLNILVDDTFKLANGAHGRRDLRRGTAVRRRARLPGGSCSIGQGLDMRYTKCYTLPNPLFGRRDKLFCDIPHTDDGDDGDDYHDDEDEDGPSHSGHDNDEVDDDEGGRWLSPTGDTLEGLVRSLVEKTTT
ncbi:hypothetical protein FHL15_001158 [Xylaria flabelliformis]|uniref:Uncharacterized protein n=1 Tax=Xylaria flabelliformis TaxID=2512241 RepID=A0A553ICL4_9PEZI|nr:hypothetical protein FHL15_001158 [Xylaria flabelliformis]